MSKIIEEINDARSTIVDWVPLANRDYRYTFNIKAFVLIVRVVGFFIILLGIWTYFTIGLPRSSWHEMVVMSSVQTSTVCTSNSQENTKTYAHRYIYVVDGKPYQTKSKYCDSLSSDTKILYNPSAPQESVLAGVDSQAGGLFLVIVGVVTILFGVVANRVVGQKTSE